MNSRVIFFLILISIGVSTSYVVAANKGLTANELSAFQDLYNDKSKQSALLSRIKIAESELKAKREIYQMNKNLWFIKSPGVSEHTYRQSEMQAAAAEWTVQEVRELYEAAGFEVNIDEKFVKIAQGGQVDPEAFTSDYFKMWSSRAKAAQFVMSRSEVELAFAVYYRDVIAKLHSKGADSKAMLIESENEFAKATENLAGAKELLRVALEAKNQFSK